MKTKLNIATTIALLMALGCAKERAVKPVVAESLRQPKNLLSTSAIRLFHKSMGKVEHNDDLPAGYYLETNKLVRLEIKETTLDIVSVDPLFVDPQDEDLVKKNKTHKSQLLARFPIKHVDVLRKQNPDGEDTHEEEVTESRRPWNERSHIVLDLKNDSQDEEMVKAKSKEVSDIEITEKSINFGVTRTMADNSQVNVRYSLLNYEPSQTYQQREYPLELRQRFGYFDTNTYKFDKFGRITQSDRKTYINRWDTSKKVVYYLSANFPEHLKGPTREVFANWNKVFKEATGKDVLELRENSGQQLGDLRYSMIVYDDTLGTSHGILGYGPSVANPRTGEIVKADVMLYGGILKTSVFRERRWQKLLGDFNPIPEQSPVVELTTPVAPDSILSPGQGFLKIADILSGAVQVKEPRAAGRLDGIIAEVLEKGNIEKLREGFKKKNLSRQAQTTTELSDDILSDVKDGVKAKMSDEELEVAIFMPLLAHELGHNLNLRHNFMGSFDEKHFDAHTKTSTVMEYGFLFSHEAPMPGQYDRGAIIAAYSDDKALIEKVTAENFYFCTDEHTMSPDYMSCNRHDAGVTLDKITESMARRYFSSWYFSNFRMDRVHFSIRDENYQQGIITKLIPIRFLFDNSMAILKANEEKDPPDVKEEDKGKVRLTSLWRLLHQRIEADPSSNPTNIREIEVLTKIHVDDGEEGPEIRTEKLKRQIDISKIDAALTDAQATLTSVQQIMAQIVLESGRPEHGVPNLVEQELEVRGVLVDKLYALMFLSLPTGDPRGTGEVISLYNGSQIMRGLMLTLLSNTQVFNLPEGVEFEGFDINLRDMAFEMVATALTESGASPIAKEILAIRKGALDMSSAEIKATVELRKEIRGLMKKLLMGGLKPEEQQPLVLQMAALEQMRMDNQGESFVQAIGNQFYIAPVVLADGMESASGRIILGEMNRLEDMMTAAKELIADLQGQLLAEINKPTKPSEPPVEGEVLQDPKKIEELQKTLQARVPALNNMIRGLSQTLAGHKASLDRFYNFYELGQK